MSLTSELNQSLDIAAGIAYAGIFTLKGGFTKNVAVRKDIKTSIIIEFLHS